MDSLIQEPAISSDPILYNNIPGNTPIRDSPFQYYEVQPLDTEDSNFHPRKSDAGIVAHVDDSGAETNLFMDHQSSSLYSKYSSTTTFSFVVHQPSPIQTQMDPLVEDAVPSNLDTFPFTLTVEPPTNNQ